MSSVIGYLELELFIPSARSLKEKRAVVRRVIERLRKKFNVSVSEVGHLDKWQLALIAVVSVGTDAGVVDATLESAVNFVEELLPGGVNSYRKELL